MPRLAGGGDRALDLGRAALVDGREDVRAVVRLDGVEGVAGANLLAADQQRDVELLRFELAEAPPKLLARGRAGREVVGGLVVRLGGSEDRVGAHGGRF